MPGRESRDVADIHQRLDSITRQIDQISRTAPPRQDGAQRARTRRARRRPAVERRHLAARCAAVADLESRGREEDLAAGVCSARPRWSSAPLPRSIGRSAAAQARASLELAIAEIAARQSELDKTRATPDAAAQCPDDAASATATAAAGPDFSSLERHLFKITSQIEALQRARWHRAIDRRVPQRTCRDPSAPLPRRCRAGRSNRSKTKSARCPAASTTPVKAASTARRLAGIERALGEIREALRSLTPAEQLAGYDEAIRNLGAKLDLILRANDDPSTVHQLEGAIAALRAIVSNVASNDALARLSDDVHTLSSKVDQLARAGDHQRLVRRARTAHRRADLDAGKPRASAGRREHRADRRRAARPVRPSRPHAGRQRQRLRLRPSRTARVLSARTPGSRPPITVAAISAGSRTDCRTSCAISKPSMRSLPRWPKTAAARQRAGGLRPGRYRQARIVRHPPQPDRNRPPDPGFAGGRAQHARPCGRSAGDDRGRPAQRAQRTGWRRRRSIRQARGPRRNAGRCRRSRNRNCPIPPRRRRISPRRRAISMPRPVCRRHRAPRAISEILEPHAAPSRAAIETDLPPDHPLEPGTRPTAGGFALGAHRRFRKRHQRNPRQARANRPAPTNFIAAARRAAQAAAAAPPADKVAIAVPIKAAASRQGRKAAIDHHLQDPLAAGWRERGRDRARHLQDGDDPARGSGAPQLPAMENARSAPAPAHVPADDGQARLRRRRRRLR